MFLLNYTKFIFRESGPTSRKAPSAPAKGRSVQDPATKRWRWEQGTDKDFKRRFRKILGFTPSFDRKGKISRRSTYKMIRKFNKLLKKHPTEYYELDRFFKVFKIDFKGDKQLQRRMMKYGNVGLRRYVVGLMDMNDARMLLVDTLKEKQRMDMLKNKEFGLTFLERPWKKKLLFGLASYSKVPAIFKQLMAENYSNKKIDSTVLVEIATRCANYSQKDRIKVQKAVLVRGELDAKDLETIMRSIDKDRNSLPLFIAIVKHWAFNKNLLDEMWQYYKILKTSLRFNKIVAESKKIKGPQLRLMINRFAKIDKNSQVIKIIASRSDLDDQTQKLIDRVWKSRKSAKIDKETKTSQAA